MTNHPQQLLCDKQRGESSTIKASCSPVSPWLPLKNIMSLFLPWNVFEVTRYICLLCSKYGCFIRVICSNSSPRSDWNTQYEAERAPHLIESTQTWEYVNQTTLNVLLDFLKVSIILFLIFVGALDNQFYRSPLTLLLCSTMKQPLTILHKSKAQKLPIYEQNMVLV